MVVLQKTGRSTRMNDDDCLEGTIHKERGAHLSWGPTA